MSKEVDRYLELVGHRVRDCPYIWAGLQQIKNEAPLEETLAAVASALSEANDEIVKLATEALARTPIEVKVEREKSG